MPFLFSSLCLRVSQSPERLSVCVGETPVCKCKHVFQHCLQYFRLSLLCSQALDFLSFSHVYSCRGIPSVFLYLTAKQGWKQGQSQQLPPWGQF